LGVSEPGSLPLVGESGSPRYGGENLWRGGMRSFRVKFLPSFGRFVSGRAC
jgi:hypothetical protein